jgi:hypothetical protein
LGEEYSVKGQFGYRLAFAGCFLVSLLTTIFQVSREDVLKEDECIRDYTFIFTNSINKYLQDHFDLTNRYIIFCSFLMDSMILIFFGLWFTCWKSHRVMLCYLLFFGSRGVVQVSSTIIKIYPSYPRNIDVIILYRTTSS